MAGDGSGRQIGRYTSSYRGCQGFEQTWPKGVATARDYLLQWPQDLLAGKSLPAGPSAIDQAIVAVSKRSRPRYHDIRVRRGLPARGRTASDPRRPLPGDRTAAGRQQPWPDDRPPRAARDRRRPGPGRGTPGTHLRSATSTALETLGVATSKSVWDNYLPAGTVLGYTTYVTAGLVNPRTATLPATKTRAQVRDLSRHRRHREPASGSRCLLAGPCGRPVGQGPVRPRSD
jgi:hypothetical protein